MPQFNLKPNWESCKVTGRPIGVDRENGIIRGYIVAQEGPFKSQGRGEFDHESLNSIVALMSANQGGTRSNFTHANMSNDGLGKHLGRVHAPTISTAIDARTGKEVRAVRGDLHFDQSAYKTPHGNLADYVMSLAESDPAALSSSLVVKVDEEYRLEPTGAPKKGEDGQTLPPLWRPKDIHSSDIVAVGDAVDSMLGFNPIQLADLSDADKLFAALSTSDKLFDLVLAGQSREVAYARLTALRDRILERKFGDDGRPLDNVKRRQRLREKSIAS